MQDLETFANRLDELYSDGQRPAENLELMHKFMRRNKHAKLKPATLATDYEVLKIFSSWCRKSINTLNEDDIYDFLDYLDDHTYNRGGKIRKYSESSKTTFKRILNKFFTTSGFPELGKLLKEKGSRLLESKEKKDLLTKVEIEKLINTAQLPRDKALIAVLYESGCRRGELLSCRISDVDFNENGCKITFPEGKTGKRTVQLVYAASFLRSWIESHPVKQPDGQTNLEAPLWVGMYQTEKRDPNKKKAPDKKEDSNKKKDQNKKKEFHKLTDQAVYIQVKKIAKRAGITKRVFLHLFRHSRASDLAEHLTEQQLKQFLGWTQGSNMCAVYVHNPDTDNAILKMNGIEIEGTHTDGLRVGKCPRCKELNPERASFCLKCGLPLSNEAVKIENEAIAELLKQVEARDLLAKLMKGVSSYANRT